jgi:hypothetical protein
LLTDRDGMSNLYRGPSIDASYQVSDHLAKRFQRRFLEIPFGKMSRNMVGSIYGRFSVAIAHFVSIYCQTWPPQTILVSDWLISKQNSPLKSLGQVKRNLVGSIL